MDLVDLARRPFADVAPAISGSVVYMDEGAGECAHHCAGAGFILSLGAVNVLSLERVAGTVAEATPPVDVAGLHVVDPRTPVVIFTTRLLQRSKGDLLRCVGSHPGAASVTVFCAVSEEAHVAAAHAVATASGDPHAAQASGQSYERLVRDLKLAASAIMSAEHAGSAPATKSPKRTGRTPRKPTRRADDDDDDGWGDDAGGDGWGDDWGETESEKSEEDFHENSESDRTLDGMPSLHVRYFPMPLTPLSRGAFVMPAAGAAASAAVAPPAAYRGAGSHPRSLSSTAPPPDDGGDEDGAHAPVPPGVAVLANQLCAMGAHMGVRLECFALGRTSRAVARATAAAAAPEAGSHHPPSGTAALVLVDRTADMLTPAVHDGGFLHRAVMMAREGEGLGGGTIGKMWDETRKCGTGGSRRGWNGRRYGGLDPSLPTAAARTPKECLSAGDFTSPGSVDGVLAHPRDVEACARLATVHARSVEDAAAATRRWLREATDSENVRPDGSPGFTSACGGVTSAELAAFAAPLAKDPKRNARHRALLELAAAVASALPGRCRNVDGLCERRDACLRVILSETHSAAMKRRGDGSGPNAASKALVACLRDAYGPGRPGAGRGAEAAALCVAGVVAAAEAGYAEGSVSTRLGLADDDDEEDDPRRRRSAARRTPLGVDDEAAVRDALVDAVLAPPASGGRANGNSTSGSGSWAIGWRSTGTRGARRRRGNSSPTPPPRR